MSHRRGTISGRADASSAPTIEAHMDVVFVAGFGPIVSDMAVSRRFYEKTLGLALEGDEDYRHSESIDGDKHFALWRLEDAAESCFGSEVWPAGLPVPT